MDEIEATRAYHNATKHHYGRYARALGYLDWATQPDPFRRFAGAPLYLLPLREDRTPPYEALYAPGAIPPAPLSVETISTLLEGSMAVSAWKQYQEARWELRCDPSSGNLHPTEGYLILPALGGVEGLERPGVYHYAPREHGLERRATFAPDVWEALAAGFPPGTFFAGLASVHWREAWKYGERAYRYCQHDVGHALGALAFAAAALGRRIVHLEGLGDAEVSRLVGLDRDSDFAAAEREHPDLLAAIVPVAPGETVAVPRSLAPAAIEAVGRGRWTGRANALSKDHVDWEIIDVAAQACRKPRTVTIPGAASLTGGAETAAAEPAGPSALAIFKQRRSAVAMDGRTALTRAAFFRMMERAMPRAGRVPFAALGEPASVHLGLFVHRVVDLVPGLYALVRREGALLPLWAAMRERFVWERAEGAPADLPLYLLEPKDARMVAASTSCQQSIASDGVFAAAMLGEFDARLARHGAWFYRRLHWEAGLIGQVLYLEAEALGVRATGIGCFFDDPSAEAFGLRGDACRTIYHFTMGGAVDDPRLTTLAPYDDARRARAGWVPGAGEAAP